MPFCPNCGAQNEGRFCAKCGAPIGAAGAAAPSAGAGTPPPPVQLAAEGMANNVAGALCYGLGLITGVLFLVLAPYNQNKLVRFHAFQSIFLTLAWIVVSIALGIFSTIVHMILPFAVFIFVLLWPVLYLGGFVLWLLLMYKAYTNEKFKLPVIGELAEKQA
jgi:uncharacterized membrane protein